MLYEVITIGAPKVDSAAQALSALNPRTHIESVCERVTSDNVERLLDVVDVVVDGADNFAARYLANDACVFLKKPLVDGSILMFDGQATVYMPGQGCYRCLYPTPPPPGMVP